METDIIAAVPALVKQHKRHDRHDAGDEDDLRPSGPKADTPQRLSPRSTQAAAAAASPCSRSAAAGCPEQGMSPNSSAAASASPQSGHNFMFKEDLLSEPEGEAAAPLSPPGKQQAAEAGPQSPQGARHLTEEDLVQWFREQCYPGKELRIGLEWEKFLVHPDTHARATCPEVQAVLRGLVDRFGWQPVMEGEVLVSVRKDGHVVDYEPGGQLELSGAPVSSVWDVAAQEKLHLEQVQEVAKGLGLAVLSTGWDPASSLSGVPLMPRERARAFWELLPQVGRTGRDIMMKSCSIQVSLDFLDEADMVRKLRVGLGLQPVAVALFACSPFQDGKPTGCMSTRAQQWFNVDTSRTGILPFVFEDGMGFERYVRYAMDVPLLWVRRQGHLLPCCGQRWQDFMQGRLPALPGEHATLKDWMMHLGTTFPQVRLKGVLEMRGADAGPAEMVIALAAFWVGLLYRDSVLAAAEKLVCSWSQQERDQLHDQAPKLGLKVPFRDGTLLDVARQAVAWARQGLEERGKGEEVFLAPLQRIVDSGRCLAEEMLDGYNGSWGHSVDPQYAASV